MRFLGIGEECELGDMYQRLAQAGHEVRVFIESEASHDVFGNMIERVPDWNAHLHWIKEAGGDGVILFESALKGALQDSLRAEGYQVIGGSRYGDRLEGDREFGQAELREAGIQTAASREFTNYAAGMDFVRAHPGRYVFKSNGADSLRTRNYVGQMDDGRDVIALLHQYAAQCDGALQPGFVLMRHLQGVEVGVGAYFNGDSFLAPACLDWEHKRFFPDDLGELTGEMGTIVTYRHSTTIFEATLAKMAGKLRAGGYVGYINLNLIANRQGLWPLEFTSRFGYPGFAICETLHGERWDSIFRKMLGRGGERIATRPGFAAGIVLTVPPFPYAYGYALLSKGAPVFFRSPLTEAQRSRLHFCQVAEDEGQLIASGTTGCIAVATGKGATVEAARLQACRLADQILVANIRYRRDIGKKLVEHDLAFLRACGYIR